MRKRRVKLAKADIVFYTAKNIFMVSFYIIILYPVIYIVSASFSDPLSVLAGEVWLFPVKPSLNAYIVVLRNVQIMTGFMNSFIYMFAGTSLNLVMTLLAAYPLSRHELYGRTAFMGLFVFTMLFSGGLVPTYLVVRDLGILNTRLAMIIPVAMSVWNVIITRTFLQTTIPQELYEASELDGGSDITCLLNIVVPLSGPIMAVMALYYGVMHWNSYFNALIYLNSSKLYPLQIILRSILILNKTDQTMASAYSTMVNKQALIDILKYSIIVVSSLPVICIYPFVEKFFKKGIMIGALKG